MEISYASLSSVLMDVDGIRRVTEQFFTKIQICFSIIVKNIHELSDFDIIGHCFTLCWKMNNHHTLFLLKSPQYVTFSKAIADRKAIA